MNKCFKNISILLCTIASPQSLAEWSGYASLQDRYFLNEPIATNYQQHNNYLSLAIEPEYYTAWNNDSQSLTITAFIRADQYDDERSHGDLRELSYQQVFDAWELRVGFSKVYWGVTESQHLVDIINQTDNAENIDGEDKLGQPMVKASFEKDWGTIDVFVLPYFRERTFQGLEGRPRSYPVVDTNQVLYEDNDDREKHIDYALRWFNYLGDLEIGLSYFSGTSREPLFSPGNISTNSSLIPYYPLMQQYSVDAQLTTEEWLWKLEAIVRDWQNFDSTAQLRDEHYYALTGGFEYTFVGIAESDADLGLVIEYLYDERGEAGSSFLQNDIMAGLRLALNDAQSSEALLGAIVDLENQEHLISLEASRRFLDSWKATLEIRTFNNIHQLSRLNGLQKDDFIQLDLAYYF